MFKNKIKKGGEAKKEERRQMQGNKNFKFKNSIIFVSNGGEGGCVVRFQRGFKGNVHQSFLA